MNRLYADAYKTGVGYWPAPSIDRQIETLVKAIGLPPSWRERALELVSAENNLIDLRNERLSVEARRRRVIKLHREGAIDRVEFDREAQLAENRLRTTTPADGPIFELSIDDFERFGENRELATPEEKDQTLSCMFESLYLEVRTVQIIEVAPKSGFRYVFEGED